MDTTSIIPASQELHDFHLNYIQDILHSYVRRGSGGNQIRRIMHRAIEFHSGESLFAMGKHSKQCQYSSQPTSIHFVCVQARRRGQERERESKEGADGRESIMCITKLHISDNNGQYVLIYELTEPAIGLRIYPIILYFL